MFSSLVSVTLGSRAIDLPDLIRCIIAMGERKKEEKMLQGNRSDVEILGLKEISQYLAKQSCKKHDPGPLINEPTILLRSKSVF